MKSSAMQTLAPISFAAAVVCALSAAFRGVNPIAALAVAVVLLALGVFFARRSGWRPRIELFSLVLSVFSVFISYQVMEIAVRVLVPETRMQPIHYLPHPEAVKMHSPGFMKRSRVQSSEGIWKPFDVRLNSKGVRGPEVPPKAPGEFRVVLIGDSYTFGWGVNEADTIGAQLEAMLSARADGRSVRVINGGVGGTGPWQAEIYLREIYFGFEPDAVILQTFAANDIQDTLMRDGVYLPAYAEPWAELENLLRQSDRWPVRVNRWLQWRSGVYRLIEDRLVGQHFVVRAANQLRLTEPVVLLPPKRSESHSWSIEIDRSVPLPEVEQGFEAFGKSIDAIAKACAERGVDFAVYQIPWPIDPAVFELLASEAPELEYELDKGSRRVEALFEAGDYEWIPILDDLRKYPQPSSLQFRYDGHMTERGYGFIAARLAEHILPKLHK